MLNNGVCRRPNPQVAPCAPCLAEEAFVRNETTPSCRMVRTGRELQRRHTTGNSLRGASHDRYMTNSPGPMHGIAVGPCLYASSRQADGASVSVRRPTPLGRG